MQNTELAQRIEAVQTLWHRCRKEGRDPTDQELDAMVPAHDSWANRYHGEERGPCLAKQPPPKPTSGGKVCTKCGIPQPLHNFSRLKKSWRAQCKRCNSLTWMEWRNNRRIRRGD